MSPRGVLLYGPPASGKSTITRLLEESGEFRLFERLKVGAGRREGYRMTSQNALSRLRADGLILWENERYGATYAVDRPGLDAALAGPMVPVLHLGQLEAISAVTDAYPDGTWLTVELWADLVETEGRLQQRKDHDLQERLDAWAETLRLNRADLRQDTTHQSPPQTATEIRRRYLHLALGSD